MMNPVMGRPSLPAVVMAALGLLGLLIATLMLAWPARAQDATLIKNTGQTVESFNAGLNHPEKRAQGFTTGSHSGGYRLSSVGVRFHTVANPAQAGNDLTVRLHRETNGNPGTAVCTLNNPQSITSDAVNSFGAPDDCGVLSGSPTYFVVVERSGTGAGSIGLRITTTGDDDANGTSGWSILDERHWHNSNGWGQKTGEAYLIEVRGSEAEVTNTPATGAPTISGTVQVGETLTADTSAIEDADGLTNVSYTYQWLADDADISSATASTHTLTISEQGKAIKVQVSFTDDAGNAESLTSAATAVVAAKPNTPATGQPTISGTAQVGETLTADTSGISDDDGLDDVSYGYQWLADDAEITDATGGTYTLTTGEQGKAVKVKVSFTDDADNEESLTSSATAAVVPKVTLPVHITRAHWRWDSAEPHNTVNFDFTIHEDPGNTGYPGIYFMLGHGKLGGTPWYAGLQTNVFRSGEGGVGKGLIFSRWNTRSLDNTRPAETGWSTSSGHEGDFVSVRHQYHWTTGSYTVKIGPDDGNNWYGAWITEHKNGETTWLGSLKFENEEGHGTLLFSILEAYGSQSIKMADIPLSKITIAPPHNERGERPSKVSFYHSETVTNHVIKYDERTGEVTFAAGRDTVQLNLHPRGRQYAVPSVEDTPPSSPATGAPTISGTVQVGQTLIVDTSAIEDADGLTNVSYGYQWLADDVDIAEATASTYTLTDADEGKAIKVQVSFTDDSDNKETLTSEPTDAVAAKPNTTAAGLPTISGKAQAGETLTADTSAITDADGLTNATFAYQWIGSDSGADADIGGETGSTYVISDDDLGRTIRVRVSFTDDGGYEEALTSRATAAVTVVDEEDMLWSADMSLVELVASGAVRADEFSNIGGSTTLGMERFLYCPPTRMLYLFFEDDVPGTAALTLQVGNVLLTLQPGGTFYEWEVDLDWEGGQTIAVRLFPTSAMEGEPQPNSLASGVPAISGTAKVGEILTADTSAIADADGLSNVSYGYQWLADDTEITGATASTYSLAESEQGKAVKVRVSFTDDADNDESLTSAATATVAARDRELIKNTGQAVESFNAALSGAGAKRAQGFTTGSNNGGYRLSSVGVRFHEVGNSGLAAGDLTVKLFGDTSGDPGGQVCVLTNPASIVGDAVNSFAAPDGCGVLSKDTDYFVVVERTGAAAGSIGLRITETGDEDAGGETGWSIHDDRHWHNSEGWGKKTDEAYLIEVRGAEVD